jgi:hypothetical protein
MKTLKLIGALIVLYACFALNTTQVLTTIQEDPSSNFQINESI